MGKLWENMVKTTGKYTKKVWDNSWGNDGIKVVPPFLGPKLLNSLGSVGKSYPTSLMGEHQATNNGLLLGSVVKSRINYLFGNGLYHP
jgi:hypothetical protein